MSAVEPSDVAWRAAALHRDRRPAAVEVRRAGLDGERLDLPDASYDAALSTFTMCTIPDLDAALAEVRRVLRPGGRLHFAEHGLAPEPGVARWQHRLEPVQRRLFAGCHLTRPIDERIERAGFAIGELERFYAPGPKPFGALYLGLGRRRAEAPLGRASARVSRGTPRTWLPVPSAAIQTPAAPSTAPPRVSAK